MRLHDHLTSLGVFISQQCMGSKWGNLSGGNPLQLSTSCAWSKLEISKMPLTCACSLLPCGEQQEGSMCGVFVRTSPMKHSFQSFDLFPSTKGWRDDIITRLCVWEVPSWSNITTSHVLLESIWSSGCFSGFGGHFGSPSHSSCNMRWAATSIWIPWRRVSDGEEKILYLEDLLLL